MSTKAAKAATETVLDWKNSEAIDKAVAKFLAANAKADFKGQLHTLLVACAMHAVHVNGADKLTNLYNQLDDGWNKKNGILVWIEAATDYRWRKDKAGGNKFLAEKKSHVFRSEYEKKPFWTLSAVKQKNSEPFDLFKALMAFSKKVDKNVEEMERPLTDVENKVLAGLHDMVKGFTPATKEVSQAA